MGATLQLNLKLSGCHDPELFPEPDVIATEMPVVSHCSDLAS